MAGDLGLARKTSIATIERADGASYTVAASERLIGSGVDAWDASSYFVVAGDVAPDGCPVSEATRQFRGDAGSDWRIHGWKDTLYNHASRPNAGASCISDDGRSAFLGASSGHPGLVNTLMFDGGVRTYTNKVDPIIWRDAATMGVGKP